MENIINVKDMTFEYVTIDSKFKAIDDLSIYVEKGKIFGLLGPNGSGKSTTINCILSLLNFEKGSIKIFGKEMQPNCYDIKSKIDESKLVVVRPKTILTSQDTLRFKKEFCEKMFKEGYEIGKTLNISN